MAKHCSGCWNDRVSNDSRYMFKQYSGCWNHLSSSLPNTVTSILTTTAAILTPTTFSYSAIAAHYLAEARWVNKLSSKPLMEAQESLSNFTVVPLYSVKGEYVTAVEKYCHKLPSKMAEELMVEDSRIIKCACHSKPTIPCEEARDLEELKQDMSRVKCTVDKGMAMDRENIMQKSRVIYRYKCDWLECDEEYIGESARTFGERLKEHSRAPSPQLCPCQHHRSQYQWQFSHCG